MFVPFVLLALSLAGAGASVVLLGPSVTGPLALSGLSAVAALILLLRGPRRRANWIVVDGSNVLHWDHKVPDIQSVRYVLGALKSEGFKPLVWFDANAGYLICEKYLGPADLAKMLELPARQVMVAPKGTPADPLLLDAARKLGARVVTNDRYRDWVEEFPQIRERGFLVRGRMGRDDFELELGA